MAQRPRMVRRIAGLRRAVAGYRAAGETVALVPTMGALHDGHVSLVRRAGFKAKRVVVSIFVNPTQFAPSEDFESYPRSLVTDLATLAGAKADLAWVPAAAEMYPDGFSASVVPQGPAAVGLEDAFRPHFFSGVATVVAKLLLQVLPDIAVFGEKDFQQLRVVTRMAKDLDIPVRIIGAPTSWPRAARRSSAPGSGSTISRRGTPRPCARSWLRAKAACVCWWPPRWGPPG